MWQGNKVRLKPRHQPGEVIWVPSGWYHQVLNLDFVRSQPPRLLAWTAANDYVQCISINHNFFCSPTLPAIYAALCVSQRRVERSIADVHDMIIQRLGAGEEAEREWVMEVQGLLERDAGWGWRGFWECILLNVQVCLVVFPCHRPHWRSGAETPELNNTVAAFVVGRRRNASVSLRGH